jgi:lon-related putative ATP-dependent protease
MARRATQGKKTPAEATVTPTDHRLPPEQLRRGEDPAVFEFECTEDLVPLSEFIGQERAVRSLQFGLGVNRPGYNIFVTGLTGTGKSTAIHEHIEKAIADQRSADKAEPPNDWCYVYNFDDPDRPRAISLPPGSAKRLKDDLDRLLTSIRTSLTNAFTSEEYGRQRKEVLDEGQKRAQPLIEDVERKAEQAGFMLRLTPAGVTLIPLTEGRPMTPEEFGALDSARRHEIEARQEPISDTVDQVRELLRSIETEVNDKLLELDRRVAEWVLKGLFDKLEAAYAEIPVVREFLQKLREFTLESAEVLRREPEQSVPAAIGAPPITPANQPDPFAAFRCNVFVDNSSAKGPPIIVEANPSWTNLFGRIDRKAFFGTYVSDHTMLKPGSVHQANGGYLILNLVDIVTKPGAWEGLKRVVRTREIRLEDPMEQYGFFQPQTLRPEPIPADVKLVITGDPAAYFMLSAYDEEFWEMFKVKADFDTQIERTRENVLAYAGFICACVEREGLRHFERSAVAEVIGHGSRMVDDQEKLSARFGRLRDVVVEADYWAGQDGASLVQASHVERAINERVYRLNMIEERIRELIARGVILVDVEGSVVGQVNGLAVLDFGDFAFGRPSRITARTFLGQRGVTSIDRESQLSGKIHDKGVLILSGYLGWKYAQDKPLSLSASISFEQGYDAIEGDSASLAELCAILSSLADAPIRQDLAMTGSVSQRGDVQPIGGINQKVEGFHDVCREVGFTGKQGVVMPARNKHNLMLRKDVVESVRSGNFHISAVENVDQAIELLTGLEAGVRADDGSYPDGTVNGRVDARLREMGEAMRQFGRRSRDGASPEKEAASPTGTEPDEARNDELDDNERGDY